jgi:hypothetical protein
MNIRRSRTGLALRVVSLEVNAGWLERIHRAIEKEIERGVTRLKVSEGTMPDDYHAIIEDEESEQTEELLGIAFVACQSYMNRIWTQVQAFNNVCSDEFGKKVSRLTDIQQVLQIGTVRIPRSRLTQAEAIFAAANYWKHSEEWPVRKQGIIRKNKKRSSREVWDGKKIRRKPVAKHTYDAVYKLGMRHGNTGNLRQVAMRLGTNKFEDLRPIRDALSLWANALLSVANEEFEKLSAGQQNAGT